MQSLLSKTIKQIFMKKITTLLLVAALAFAFVMPAKAVPKPHPKDALKTEFAAKVVKAEKATFILTNLDAVKTVEKSAITHLNYSEANRPPGISVAKANLARYNRYKNRDALIKYINLKPDTGTPPNIRRSC